MKSDTAAAPPDRALGGRAKHGRVNAAGGEPEDAERLPVTWALVRRILGYTKPYARRRNALFLACALRAVQLTAVPWIVERIITGPITSGNSRSSRIGSPA